MKTVMFGYMTIFFSIVQKERKPVTSSIPANKEEHSFAPCLWATGCCDHDPLDGDSLEKL